MSQTPNLIVAFAINQHLAHMTSDRSHATSHDDSIHGQQMHAQSTSELNLKAVMLDLDLTELPQSPMKCRINQSNNYVVCAITLNIRSRSFEVKTKQVVAKVIWRRPHRIPWGESGLRLTSLHLKQDLDPFSCVCTAKPRDRRTDRRPGSSIAIVRISCIRCRLKTNDTADTYTDNGMPDASHTCHRPTLDLSHMTMHSNNLVSLFDEP